MWVCPREERREQSESGEERRSRQNICVCVSLAILFCQHSDISVCMRNYCKSYLVVVPRTSGRPSLIVLRMRGSRNTI